MLVCIVLVLAWGCAVSVLLENHRFFFFSGLWDGAATHTTMGINSKQACSHGQGGVMMGWGSWEVHGRAVGCDERAQEKFASNLKLLREDLEEIMEKFECPARDPGSSPGLGPDRILGPVSGLGPTRTTLLETGDGQAQQGIVELISAGTGTALEYEWRHIGD
ncbi:hypothetical protein B0H10DRAFT_1959144 [Mycena sp. CBHHK59/15]|nr:hypothetical protein B0H10DRAFT_1959144 [Mycena sp. CBHHK59/15]